MSDRPVPPTDDVLSRPDPPWWWILGDPAGPDAALTAARRGRAAGLEVRVLPGERLRTLDALLAEFARTWVFPAYFGHNVSALEDCLLDLAWLPARGYLCVITGAGQLLGDAPDDVLGLFLDLLARVGAGWAAPVRRGEAWDRPAVPFHTVLGTRGEAGSARLLARAAAGGADLRAGLNGPGLNGPGLNGPS
jgi:hypothetical protein